MTIDPATVTLLIAAYPVVTGILDATLIRWMRPKYPELAAALEKLFVDIDGLLRRKQ